MIAFSHRLSCHSETEESRQDDQEREPNTTELGFTNTKPL